jgi:hypothetical protein
MASDVQAGMLANIDRDAMRSHRFDERAISRLS